MVYNVYTISIFHTYYNSLTFYFDYRFYEMTKHVRNKHPDVETHSCDSCGKVFDRLTMLYRHKSDGHCMPNKQC